MIHTQCHTSYHVSKLYSDVTAVENLPFSDHIQGIIWTILQSHPLSDKDAPLNHSCLPSVF